MKVLIAAGSGGCGGFVGTPGDMINVRMQNDMRVAKELRRGFVSLALFRICFILQL
jgi:dicarboxylate transporter 10